MFQHMEISIIRLRVDVWSTAKKLREVNGRFTFDLEDMERKVTNRTKAFLLCNPHNPTGTVWTEQELEGICRFCKAHELLIISDEAHYDFVFHGQHTMLRKLLRNMMYHQLR